MRGAFSARRILLTCAMLTLTGRTNGPYVSHWCDNVAKIIGHMRGEADRSNASAVVHKSRSEAEATFLRQLIGSTEMEKR